MIAILPLLLQLVFAALVITAMYWLVRLAVRHALEDADKRRSKSGVQGSDL